MEDQKFDGLSKMLARGPLSRRQVLAGFGGVMAAIGLGSLAPGRAFATDCGSELCGATGYTCGGPIPVCGTNQENGQLCFCANDAEGNVYCATNYFCGTRTLCNDSSDCLDTEICSVTDCCAGTAHARGFRGFCAARCACGEGAAPAHTPAGIEHGTALLH